MNEFVGKMHSKVKFWVNRVKKFSSFFGNIINKSAMKSRNLNIKGFYAVYSF